MRTQLALTVAVWIGVGLARAGGTEFPYKAYVTGEGVQVRSGPGDDYYATDRMKAGDQVEVWRHDPGGWYAVRPPVGSFSWVSGRYLEKPNRDHVAAVSGQQVAARVGSRLSDLRDVIQVRLQKGELVEVLGTRSNDEDQNPGSVWYKIAPPSGEFRWIHSKYLDPDYPHDGLSKSHSGAAATPAAESAATPSPAKPAAAEAALPLRNLSPEEFQKALEDADVELSLAVAEEIGRWNFDRLRPRVEALVVQAHTALERGRARLLLKKIVRFEDIKKRNDSLQTMQAQVARADAQAARADQGTNDVLLTARGVERFDGVGRLAPVAVPTAGGPRYALVERDGSIRCYVTAAPGVNLQYYVGRQVGLTGIRGYMPQQQAQHVTAKHVTTLDDNLLLR